MTNHNEPPYPYERDFEDDDDRLEATLARSRFLNGLAAFPRLLASMIFGDVEDEEEMG